MSERMWGLFGESGYLVAVHHRRHECIEEARGFWGPGWQWRRIKSRYGWYVARVIVTKEADHD